MKKLTAVLSASVLAVSWGSAFAACEYPSKVDIPNGAEASKDEMVAGSKAIKGYMETMNTYLDCIAEESKSAAAEGESAEVTKERELLLAKRHNAAVDEMEGLAAEFNVQVRAYKAKGE
ncbi:MAG: hypothetical protein AB8F65_06485 [Woeseiaceae bacterium]